MRASFRWFFLAGVPLSIAVIPLACDGSGPLEIVVRPGFLDDGGPSYDALYPDTGDDDGGPNVDAGDAGTSPVIVALSPSPKGDPPTAGDVISARLDALAAGVRGMVIRRAPTELDEPSELASLSSEVSFWASRGVSLAFSLGLIDRSIRGLPSSLDNLPLDAPDVLAATHAAIDNALGALSGNARFVTIGRDVDVYLAAHPEPEERAALEKLLLDSVEYIREHPLAAENTRIGVGFSYAGVSTQDPSFNLMLDVSDVAVISYLPGIGGSEAGLTSAIASDADVMLSRSGGKPIVLEAVGYPSASVVGGSVAKQALFLDTLFEALVPRRAGFAFVNVDALHDVGSSPCAELAKHAGEAPDGPYAAYVCSLGMFTSLGQEKPVWLSFLKGAAAFASP